MSLAYISSLARIFFALTNICFSPVERPFSWSRRERFRTTSASSKMSPVFILSRLCLKRRFQFFGICVPPPVSAFSTLLTICSSITLRRPTASAFSVGTFTVMSLWRILIVMYSRFCPSTVRDSFFTTVPAPWCGYTTLSPTLYKPSLPFSSLTSPERRRDCTPPATALRIAKNPLQKPSISRDFRLSTRKPCSERTPVALKAEGIGRGDCAPAGGGDPRGSLGREPCRLRPRPPGPAVTRGRFPRARRARRRDAG